MNLPFRECSFLVRDKIIIGKYPSQNEADLLDKLGETYFVNLTCKNENLPPYKGSRKISFPILDRNVPKNMETFRAFIETLHRVYTKENSIIYIHCRGGHGRTGVVAACLLSVIFSMNAAEALTETRKRHSEREIMLEKWRKIGSPQTKIQKDFVCKFVN